MLKKLELINFKTIKSYSFDLKPLSIFTGLNGVGKSTVLQSLLLLRQSFDEHHIHNGRVTLNGKYMNFGNSSDLLYTYTDDEHLEVNLSYEGDSFDFKIHHEQNLSELNILKKTNLNCPLFEQRFLYLSAERISPKTIYNLSSYEVLTARTLGKTGEYSAHFLAYHGGEKLAVDALKHPKSNTLLLRDNVNSWISEITPGTSVIAVADHDVEIATLHYQFTLGSVKTKKIKPENTGFGLTYVLPIIIAILSSKPGDFIIVENPESHLHPAGQSKLAKLISIASENGVQIILETHSDHILNGVRLATKHKQISNDNVTFFYLTKDVETDHHDVVIEELKIQNDGSIDKWPDGFFDEWDNALSDLLDI